MAPRHLSRSPPAMHTASMLVLALAILAAPARADPVAPAAAVPGATFEEVLAIARRLSPELAARALAYSSRPGEHVLDLFGGSGSTLIAAEQADRRAFLMELDPLYCDVIVARWEGFTGRKAERRRGSL